MKNYEFVTAGGGTCIFTIVGESYDGSADMAVACGDYYREWDEIDAGCVDDMFIDLLENGVRFDSKRSLVANVMIVSSVMLDRDSTVHGVLAKVDAMSDEDVDAKLDYWFDTANVTAAKDAWKPEGKRQPTREEVIEHGEYLGATEYASGATEQRWVLNGIVFSEVCDADGRRGSWTCLDKASRVLK